MSAEHNPATAPGQAASSAAERIAPAVPTGVAHKVVSIGDAVKVGKVIDAIEAGFLAGMSA